MKNLFSISSILALGSILFIILSCNTKPDPQNDNSTQQRPSQTLEVPKMLDRDNAKDFKEPTFNIGNEIVAYKMEWLQRDPEQIVQRIAGSLNILLGHEDLSYDTETLISIVDEKNVGHWVRLNNSPILIKYQQAYDEIRIIHEEREAMFSSVKDIGEVAIQGVAEKYIAQLGERGLIDSRLYANAVMQLGYKIIGEGTIDEKETNPGVIAEYRITFRPRLNGIEMANTGIRLGILPSGELSNLRFGGVTPEGEWRGNELKPGSKKFIRKIQTNINELMSRFYNEKLKVDNIQVAYSKVMYVMPYDDKSEAIVEPMLVISYTNQKRIDEQLVSSRRKTVAYSLTDLEASIIDFDAPVKSHEGTLPERNR